MAKGQDRAARTYLRNSYFTASTIWRGQSLPEGLRMLGELSQSAALFDSAYFFYDRAREEYRNQAKRSNAYNMTLAIGSLWLQMNRPHDVRALYEEALRLAMVFGDSADARELRWALLPVYAELEEREAERKTADQLFGWARNAGDQKSEARVLEETGISLADRGESAAAIDAFLRAMTLADQTKDSVGGLKIMVHLGRALDAIGRSQDALETFHTALQRTGTLARNHDLHVELLMRTGNLLLRLKEPDHALQYFRTALPIAQQRGNALAEAYATVQMGHATTRRNHPEALAFFRSGYDQFRTFAYAPGVAYALVSLGEIAESENRLTDALQLYEAAAKEQAGLAAKRPADDLFEECEAAGLGPQGNNATSALVTLLLQLGRAEDAYAVQQQANIRALSGDFATWTFRTGNAAIDALLAEYAAARSDQAGAEREAERLMSSRPENKTLLREIHGVLQSSRERAKECTEELQRVRPDLAPIAGAIGLRPADIQKRLPEGTALLTFIPTRRSWFTSVITRQQALVEVTGQSSEQVLRAAREYTQILRERIAEADTLGPGYSVLDNRLRDLSRRLHEALLLPVERSLRAAARVAVQFPAAMPVIPVHALRRGGSTGNPALIEVCEVHYVTTPYAITTRLSSAAPVRSVTCIGYPGNTAWDV
ncbi:MAG: tetratricopeptide repeat protein, partial [Bacteroidetes bacterium]|nr:tetratricopeptide repeat protein [Bacteroidota bacterium]